MYDGLDVPVAMHLHQLRRIILSSGRWWQIRRWTSPSSRKECPVNKLLKPASCQAAVRFVQMASTAPVGALCALVPVAVLNGVLLHRTGMRICTDLRKLAEERLRFDVLLLHVLLRSEGLVGNYMQPERLCVP